MTLMWFFSIPAIAFVVIVIPLWLVFHYVTKWKMMKGGTLGDGMVAVDKRELEQLSETADRLATRLGALENILDAQSSDWKTR